MKLLIISSVFPPFRAPESAHVRMLCQEIAAQGVDVHLLTTKQSFQAVTSQGFHVHPVMKAWDWRRLPTLLEFIRKLKPDAILLIYIDWIYSLHLMVTLLPAFLRRLLPRTAFITQFENVSGLVDVEPPRSRSHRAMKSVAAFVCAPRSLHRIYGALLRDSDRIISLSERHVDVFEREYPGAKAKTTVLPPPPLLSLRMGAKEQIRAEGRAQLGIDEDALLLLYFGYIYAGKGVETLLRAYALLRSRSPGIGKRSLKLAIVGWISEPALVDDLSRLEAALGLRGSVIWTGYVDSEATASTYLHAGDIAVLPFDDGVRLNNSSFAVCAIHGLPIVTTRGEELESTFKDQENVAVCPPTNPEALAHTIELVASSPALRDRIARGAAELAASIFNSTNVVSATLEVIEAACAEHRRPKAAMVPVVS